jgi:hypothetical protein
MTIFLAAGKENMIKLLAEKLLVLLSSAFYDRDIIRWKSLLDDVPDQRGCVGCVSGRL